METRRKLGTPEIKICGITTEEELSWLLEEQVEYAGFVLWEKSKRYISIEQAGLLFHSFNSNIKKVAVTVEPDVDILKQIEAAGFDILQVHGTLSKEVAEASKLPIWRAVNLSTLTELEGLMQEFVEKDFFKNKKITAVLADAKEYGSGKTFGWEDFTEEKDNYPVFSDFRRLLEKEQIRFILAGGLTPANVEKGRKIFAPDIVDVSSGVEREKTAGVTPGKDREKIKQFVQNARK